MNTAVSSLRKSPDLRPNDQPRMRPYRARLGVIEALEARIAPATFTVTNVSDSGVGSLRQAILNAEANNNAAVVDTINFNILGFGPHTITLNSALPTITEPVALNGQSNPDFEG